MNEINLFDLNLTDDLPAEVKGNLKPTRLHENSLKMMELFDLKKELSIDEIIVGFYRKFKLEKSRSWLSTTLYNLSKQGFIHKVKGKKGVYTKGPKP